VAAGIDDHAIDNPHRTTAIQIDKPAIVGERDVIAVKNKVDETDIVGVGGCEESRASG
jgi:hypothetical protein